MRMLKCAVCLAVLGCSLRSSTAQTNIPSLNPRLYLSNADVTRLRQQARNPALAAAYADLETKTNTSVDAWRKKYPATTAPRSTAELITIGKRDNPSPDAKTIATAYALHPTPLLGTVLREKLMAAIGVRQINNYWFNDGIHEGEASMQFLEAYDLATAAALMTADDKQAVKEELRRCGHFLQGWMLDSWWPDKRFSQGYTWYYRTVYCLNFHIFATSMMGTIAMLYPDLPESAEWLRSAQAELPKLLFTEFGLDGGYGEGSLHYWSLSTHALLQFMVAIRNLGVRDYFADPAFTDAMRRTLEWRMNLTEPDGRIFAVGDSDRDTVGAEILIEGGKLLNQPAFVWVGRTIIERARPGMIPDDPYELFHYDLSAAASAPTALSANHRFSGYGIFRSGWGAQDNYVLLKYGTTFIGRREDETNLVISGHAHADALELELCYKGIPITVDRGRVGRYQDWDTYGGYSKATVAHNTVGIGNPWSYDRLDGLYAEHVKQHGKEFLYETSQNDIGRADTELRAFGDVGEIGIISAKLKTYDHVTQQRSVVWFRDLGVAVVNDQMESDREQPYEWYLNPAGNLLAHDKVLTFGDDAARLDLARLDVVPILPGDETVQTVSKGDPKLPPYYFSLRPTEVPGGWSPNNRWDNFTLLVLKKNAASTDFLNVLIPYKVTANEKVSPFAVSPMGAKGARLTGKETALLVSSRGNDDASLSTDGSFAVARLDQGSLSSYALHHGFNLALGDETLMKVELLSKPWEPFFDSAVTGAVSLADRRASFSFPLSPMDKGLIMYSPKVKEGEEQPLPLQVAVSFRVNEKPTRIVALRSATETPKLDDPEFDRMTAGWENDPHEGHYLREPLDFTWDAEKKLLTVILDVGIRQLVWE
jgi:hypothetical protein